MVEGFAAALAAGGTREERKAAAEAALASRASTLEAGRQEAACEEVDLENGTLYGLLRLRFNDDDGAPRAMFPELNRCALIRELHVYGSLVAAGREQSETTQGKNDERPQHIGIGRTLMGTAELIAAAHGWTRISVIAGVGVRNYYRKLGYVLQGDGQYLIKELPPCPVAERGRAPLSFEASFLDAGVRVKALKQRPRNQMCTAAVATVGITAAALGAIALTRHLRRS